MGEIYFEGAAFFQVVVQDSRVYRLAAERLPGGGKFTLLRDDAVGAFAVFTRDRVDAQTHFRFQRSAKEATDRVSLPSGRFPEFLQRSAIRSL